MCLLGAHCHTSPWAEVACSQALRLGVRPVNRILWPPPSSLTALHVRHPSYFAPRNDQTPTLWCTLAWSSQMPFTVIISAATSDPPNPFCNSIFLVRPRALCRRAIIDFDASGRLASRDAAQIVPQPHPTSWPSCPVEIAALAALYLLPRSSWSSRQPPNVNECPRRAPRGQTRAHGTQSICRHRGNREAHRRRARTARESNCAAPALDQPSAAVASRGGPADCACADSRGCLTRDGCAIHRHANLDAHLLLRAAEPKNR